MANLASTYRNQGQWKEAEELDVQVIETRKRVLGEEHPDTLTSMADLASTYRNQGWWKEAEELEVQVMETRKRVLGEEYPDTLTSKGNLALRPPSTTLDSYMLTQKDAPPQVPSFLSLLLARLALRPPSTALDFCMLTLGCPCWSRVWILLPKYPLPCSHYLHLRLSGLLPPPLIPVCRCQVGHAGQYVRMLLPKHPLPCLYYLHV